MGQHRQFAMTSHAPQKVARKVEVLAKLPWLSNMTKRKVALGLAAWLATPAHKVRPSIYADFSIGAAKLLDTKAAVLLRHAKTRLHLQAVASLLDVPRGAHVDSTSSAAALVPSGTEVSADPVYRTEALTDCLAAEPADSPRRACASMLRARARARACSQLCNT